MQPLPLNFSTHRKVVYQGEKKKERKKEGKYKNHLSSGVQGEPVKIDTPFSKKGGWQLNELRHAKPRRAMGSPTSMMIAWCLTEDSNFACMEGMRNCFGQRCEY